MVKNHGGNKAKKQGRKFANASQTLAATRLSQDPDELYACCSKIFGNGKIGVQCHDGKERICIIRNKFRGRGKRGNTVQIGSWLLVGRRSFEKAREGEFFSLMISKVLDIILSPRIKIYFDKFNIV